MRIKIGPYTSWFGPYQLASALCFWAKDEVDEHGFKQRPDWVHDFGEWLAHGSIEPDADITRLDDDRDVTLLYKFLAWIESKKKRTEEIHIDKWDTWSMDSTLGLIILPMLKQLQETKHGSPMVDDEDVPEALKIRSTDAAAYEEWETDDNVHKRWDWVLNEMIWAFEQINDEDNDAQFHTGTHDIYFEKINDGTGNSEMKTGPKDTHVFDKEGYKKHQERIQRGTILFGKYYRGLWD